MKGVFVTGTDTGVGKTLVSCALLAGFRRAGLRTAAMKPVASGSEPTRLGLRNRDALQLAVHSDCDLPYEVVNPYTFRPAIAPHIAAAREGVVIDPRRIERLYRRISSGSDICVVEGAGGWLVPLNETETMADLAVRLGLPVVLVVGMRLGCLNHALLTVQSIAAHGVPLAGWIANMAQPRMECAEENLETLCRMLPGRFLGSVPHLPGGVAEQVSESLDIGAVLAPLSLGGKQKG